MGQHTNLIGEEAAALEDEEAERQEEAAAKAAAKAKSNDEDDDDDDDATAVAAKPETKPGGEGGEAVAPTVEAGEGEEPPALKIEQPFVPPVAEVEDVDYEGERSKLLDERKELRASLRNGDIDQDEFDEKLDAVNDKLQDLAVRRERAESAVAQNQAVAAAQYQWTLGQVKRHIANTEGIDYDAPENRGLLMSWDGKIKALASDEANADKPAEWFLTEAHKQVRAEMEAIAVRLGFKKGDAPVTPKDNALKDALNKRKPDTTKAKSLANLPTAEGASTHKDGDFAHLDGLDGLELEAALARLPKDQADAYLAGK